MVFIDFFEDGEELFRRVVALLFVRDGRGLFKAAME